MERALHNLIMNAVQAMPKGGELAIGASKKEESVYVTIQDSGVGIPAEVRTRLFTPLFTTKSKGQGLGLVVSNRIIEAHGGEITFESEIGKGTTFTVKVPLNRSQPKKD